MSTYYRVGPSIWDEPWTDDERYIAVYLLTCRHRVMEGLYRLPLSYVVEDTGWTLRRVRKAFDALLDYGFVQYDESAKVAFIVKAPEWQGSKNGNQITGGVRAIREVPASSLDRGFVNAWESVSEGFAKALRKDLPKRFEYSSSTSTSNSSEEGGGIRPDDGDSPSAATLQLIEGEGQRGVA